MTNREVGQVFVDLFLSTSQECLDKCFHDASENFQLLGCSGDTGDLTLITSIRDQLQQKSSVTTTRSLHPSILTFIVKVSMRQSG